MGSDGCVERTCDWRWLHIVVVVCAMSGSANAQSVLLQELTVKGITVTNNKTIVFPKPMVIDEGSPSAREEIAGRFGWARFTKQTVVAPVWLDVDSIKDANDVKVGHTIHFRFVVHRSLDDLRNRNLMTSLFGGDEVATESPESGESEFVDISADDLNLCAVDGFTATDKHNYAFIKTPLMNRVLLQGVIEGKSSDVADTHVLAWRLVDGMTSASHFAAKWQRISKNDLGESVLESPVDYQGCGGYLAISSLGELDGELSAACLVEARLVVHEPTAWFGGNNFLRSKFPILIQEAVRKFRREMQKR